METLVLCPEELCLGPGRLTASGLMGLSPSFASEFSIWTSGDLEKGTRFLPWKGTVRSDKLPVHDKLPEFDVRHRYGLYDEISEVLPGRRLRQCNWIRFLRYSLVCNEEINVIGTKGTTGEPVFELIRDVGPKTELVAFFVPERPEEAFLLPAIQYLRHTLFKRLIDNVLEESPLDLSTSLVMSKVFNQAHAAAANVHPAVAAHGAHHHLPSSRHHNISGASQPSPAHSVEGRKSVSSDCTTSTSESDVPRPHTISTSEALHLTHTAVAAARRSLLEKVPTSCITSHLGSRPSVMIAETPPPPLTPTMSSLSRSSASPTTVGISPVTSLTTAATTTRRREKNMLPCNYCGKCFDRPSLLKRHIRIHTGERPHVCDVCSKGFSTSSSLNTHRRIHSGEKPHQCGVCGKRFTASSNLYYHKMTHVKEKPHKCTMCSKSFPTPGDLKSHTYVHTGTWPFKCHVCHRGFSKQTNLKNHLLLHSGDKPFSCDICQKKFALSCNLRAHLKTHEAEYQTSPASFALYRRTLELLGVAEAQERLDKVRQEVDEDDEEERLGSESSSPGVAGIVPGYNVSNPSLGSPHPADEEEGMEDVEEDEPDPTIVSRPSIMGHSLTTKPSAASALLSAAKTKSSGSKSRLPLGIDDYAQQLRNQIAA